MTKHHACTLLLLAALTACSQPGLPASAEPQMVQNNVYHPPRLEKLFTALDLPGVRDGLSGPTGSVQKNAQLTEARAPLSLVPDTTYILLEGQGSISTVTLKPTDSTQGGRRFDRPIRWYSSNPDVSVSFHNRLPTATVMAQTASGGSILVAMADDGSWVSAPVFVLIAPTRTGVQKIPQSSVIYPFQTFPNATPEAVTSGAVDPSQRTVGPFSLEEVLSHTWFAVSSDPDVRYHLRRQAVVLKGTTYRVGQVLLAERGVSFSGRVVSVTSREAPGGVYQLLELETAALPEVFSQLDLDIGTFNPAEPVWDRVFTQTALPETAPPDDGFQSSSLKAAPKSGKFFGMFDKCETTGSILAVKLDLLTFQMRAQPRLRVVMAGDWVKEIKLGVLLSTQASVKPGVDLQGGASIDLKCSTPKLFQKSLPFPAPLGMVLGGQFNARGSFELSGKINAGSRAQLTLKTGANASMFVGLDQDAAKPQANFEPITGNAILDPLEAGGVKAEFKSGIYLVPALGFQVGGAATQALTGLLALFAPEAATAMDEATNVDVLEGKIGPEGKLVVNTDRYALASAASSSEAGINGVLEVKLKPPKAIEDHLKKAGFGKSLDLGLLAVRFPLFPLYRVPLNNSTEFFKQDSQGQLHPLSGTIRPSKILVIQTQARLQGDRPQAFDDLVRASGYQVWISKNVLGVRQVRQLRPDEYTLQGNGLVESDLGEKAEIRVPMSAELCDELKDGGEVAVLALNQMFNVLPQPGFMKKTSVKCTDEVNVTVSPRQKSFGLRYFDPNRGWYGIGEKAFMKYQITNLEDDTVHVHMAASEGMTNLYGETNHWVCSDMQPSREGCHQHPYHSGINYQIPPFGTLILALSPECHSRSATQEERKFYNWLWFMSSAGKKQPEADGAMAQFMCVVGPRPAGVPFDEFN